MSSLSFKDGLCLAKVLVEIAKVVRSFSVSKRDERRAVRS